MAEFYKRWIDRNAYSCRKNDKLENNVLKREDGFQGRE